MCLVCHSKQHHTPQRTGKAGTQALSTRSCDSAHEFHTPSGPSQALPRAPLCVSAGRCGCRQGASPCRGRDLRTLHTLCEEVGDALARHAHTLRFEERDGLQRIGLEFRRELDAAHLSHLWRFCTFRTSGRLLASVPHRGVHATRPHTLSDSRTENCSMSMEQKHFGSTLGHV